MIEKVFIIMDNTNNTGRESVISVHEDKISAKIALADYVLKRTVDTDYIDLFEREVLFDESVRTLHRQSPQD